MRRLIAVLLLLTLLTGCDSEPGVGSLAIVRAVGIDLSDGRRTLTCQLFDPAEKTVRVVAASGDTFAGLTDACALAAGRKLYFGGTEAVLLGTSLAEEDTADTLRRLWESGVCPRAAVAVARGSAADLLLAKLPEEANGGSPLADALLTAATQGSAVPAALLEAAVDAANGQGTLMMPRLSLSGEHLDVTAVVLQTDAPALVLSVGESEALASLLGAGTRRLTLRQSDAEPVSVALNRRSCSVEPTLYRDALYLRLALAFDTDAPLPPALAALAARQLRTDVEYLLHKLLVREGVDPLLLTERLARSGVDADEIPPLLRGCSLHVEVTVG